MRRLALTLAFLLISASQVCAQGGPQASVSLYAFSQFVGSNAGFETGDFTGWSAAGPWTVDLCSNTPAGACAPGSVGTHAAKFDNTQTHTSASTLRRQDITIPANVKIFQVSFWWISSSDYNGSGSVGGSLHNATFASEGAGSNAVGDRFAGVSTTWVKYTSPPIYIPTTHTGELLSTASGDIRVSPSSAAGTGQFWIDDVQIQAYDVPLRVWTPALYRGYVWANDPQLFTVQIDVAGGSGNACLSGCGSLDPFQNALSSYELLLQLVDRTTPSTVYLSKTIQGSALSYGLNTTTFDVTGVAVGTRMLLKSTFRTSGGGAAALLSDGATPVSVPDWGIDKQTLSARNAIKGAYLDAVRGCTWMYNRCRYPWFFYSWLQAQYLAATVPSTSQSAYESILIPGRDMADVPIGAGQVAAAAPQLFANTTGQNTSTALQVSRATRDLRVNAWHDYVTGSAANPGISAGIESNSVDQIAPWMQTESAQGICHSLHTREYWIYTPGPNAATVAANGLQVSSTAHGATKAQFATFAIPTATTTTLSAPAGASDTTLSVTSNVGFGTSGTVRIDNEVMFFSCTVSCPAGQLTNVTRGIGSAGVGASHLSSATVTLETITLKEIAMVIDANNFLLASAVTAGTYNLWWYSNSSDNLIGASHLAFIDTAGSNANLWTLTGRRLMKNRCFFGWYALDEPKDPELQFNQQMYRGIRDNDGTQTGGIAWAAPGPHYGENDDPRFIYAADVFGSDEYAKQAASEPYNNHWQVAIAPLKINNVWAAQHENYIKTNGLRPTWHVNQSYNAVSTQGPPGYSDYLSEALAALIGGAKGQAWWQFGNSSGVQNFSGGTNFSATGVTTDGVSKTFSGSLQNISSINTERFVPGIAMVATAQPARRVQFNLASTVSASISSWTPDGNGNLTLVPCTIALCGSNDTTTFSTGTLNVSTGNFVLNYSSAPTTGQAINATTTRTSDSMIRDFIAMSQKFMGFESAWVNNPDDKATMVESPAYSSDSTTPSFPAIVWHSWTHPADSGKTIVAACNLKIENKTSTATTLNGSLASGATTINVTSNAGFPNSGQVQIETELATYNCGGSCPAGQLTNAVRAQFGTSQPASHPNLSAVTNVITTSGTITFTAPAVTGANPGVSVWARSTVNPATSGPIAAINYDDPGTNTTWHDTLAGSECAIYITSRDTTKPEVATDQTSNLTMLNNLPQ